MKKAPILAACIFAFSQQAYGEIQMNGFLSAAGGQIIDDDELQDYGGYDGSFSAGSDTTLGLQLSNRVADNATVTGQFIARSSNDYDVAAEWAYVSFNATDTIDVRVGRLRTPFYYYSDFLDVGFAYPWIRPPEQTYGDLSFLTTYDGFDIVNTRSLGDFDSVFQAFYGRFDTDVDVSGEILDVDIVDFLGANWALTYDFVTFRASLLHSEYTVENAAALEPLLQGLRAFSFDSVADALEINGEKGTFVGLGVNVDYNDFLFITELTQLSSDDASTYADYSSFYTTVAKRFDRFLVHFTYNQSETDPDESIAAPLSGFVAPVGVNLTEATVLQAVPDKIKEVDITVGIRMNVIDNTAIKLELTDFSIDQSGTKNNGLLLSAAVDVVF